MADEPDIGSVSPASTDVPPAPSSGGTGADDYRSRMRRRAAGGSPPPAPAAPPTSEEEDPKRPWTPAEKVLRESILELYTGAQVACQLFDPPTAVLIGATKGKCADAWMDLARRDARVKAFLKKMTTGSAWGGLVMAHAPLVLPILARRGILPGGALFGGAPFNAMPEQPEDDPNGWPGNVNVYSPDGVVAFESGNGSHAA